MKLVIEDDAGTRSTVPLGAEPVVVGRGVEGVAVRLADRNVSRRHARFLRQNGGVHVEDLGSLTGTRVNGERIAGRRRLRPGDLVQIGDYDLAVLGEEETAAAGAPPPLPGGAREAPPAPRDEPPPPPAPPPVAASSPVRRTLVAGAVALAAGAAAGWAVGELLGR